MLKADLRREYLLKRDALTAEQCEEMSVKISERFFSTIDLSNVKTLHTFLPIQKFNEVDTWTFIYRIWSQHAHIQVCSPRIDPESGGIISLPLEENTRIEESMWGIPEPVGGTPIEPHDIDVVLVPLLCADTRGYRVGYGKGYYDRFLAKCRPDCRKIGLSFFRPIEEISDVNEYDVRVDEIVMGDGKDFPNLPTFPSSRSS